MNNQHDGKHKKTNSKAKWLLGTSFIGLCALGFVTIANGQDPQRIDPKASYLTQKSASASASSSSSQKANGQYPQRIDPKAAYITQKSASSSASSSSSQTAEEAEASKARLDAQSTQSSTSKTSLDNSSKTNLVKKPVFTPLKIAPAVLKRESISTGATNWQSALKQAESNKRSGLHSKILATRIDKTVLDRTTVPVIMPVATSKIDATKAKLMSYGDSYALNMPQPKDMSVTIYGNRSFVKSDKGTVTDLTFKRVDRMAESVQISRLEDGWTASFTRYGVVYSVDLLCDVTSQCTDETQIRNIVADCSDVNMGNAAMMEAEKAAKPADSDWLRDVNKSISKTTQSLFKGA